MIKIKYVDIQTNGLQLNQGGNACATASYKLNSAWDVHSSLGNKTPVGWQNYMAMYNKYRVHAAKISTTFVNSHPDYPIYGGVFFGGTATMGSTPAWTDSMELLRGNPNAKLRMFTSRDGSRSGGRISMYRRLSSLLAEPRQYLADHDYSAAMNANPALLLFGQIFASTTDSVARTINVFVKTEVTLWVRLYDRVFALPTQINNDSDETPTNNIPNTLLTGTEIVGNEE